jgi:hypothetical protein
MSADEDIGNEIGKFLLIVLAGVVGFIGLAIYLWHHLRFVS